MLQIELTTVIYLMILLLRRDNSQAVRNKVKQESVVSLLLFAIHTDCLLKRREESVVACYMGGCISGVLA